MAKIDIEIVANALRHKAHLEESKINMVVQELQAQADAESEARREAAQARVEKTFTFLTTGASDEAGNAVGFVVQHPLELPVTELKLRLQQVIAEYKNQPVTGRKKPLPVSSFGEAFEAIPQKFFKEKDIQVKTKSPVYAVALPNNEIHLTTEAP